MASSSPKGEPEALVVLAYLIQLADEGGHAGEHLGVDVAEVVGDALVADLLYGAVLVAHHVGILTVADLLAVVALAGSVAVGLGDLAAWDRAEDVAVVGVLEGAEEGPAGELGRHAVHGDLEEATGNTSFAHLLHDGAEHLHFDDRKAEFGRTLVELLDAVFKVAKVDGGNGIVLHEPSV